MSRAKRILNHWLMHRSVTLELARRIPAGKLDFRPCDGVMSVRELISHIATSNHFFVLGVREGRFTWDLRPQGAGDGDPAALLRQYTEQDAEFIRSLTDEQLQAPVDGGEVFRMTLPASAWLSTMIDHEVHHKGQLFTYARMLGLKDLPFFVQVRRG